MSSQPVIFQRRHLVVAGSALAHLGLLLALLNAPRQTVVTPDLGVLNVSLSPAPGHAPGAPSRTERKSSTGPAPRPPDRKSRPPAPPPVDVVPQYVSLTPEDVALSQRDPLQDPVAAAVLVAAGAASGQACSLTSWLQEALQRDPQVQTALTIIPRPALSLSNALMLWDGGWIASDPKAAAGVAAIRAAVISGLRAAPARCRNPPVRGPEIMTLTMGADTTVLVIGSGEWRWADLLPSGEAESSATRDAV